MKFLSLAAAGSSKLLTLNVALFFHSDKLFKIKCEGFCRSTFEDSQRHEKGTCFKIHKLQELQRTANDMFIVSMFESCV